LESQNADLHGAVAELNARMQKYRKGYKDMGMYTNCLVMSNCQVNVDLVVNVLMFCMSRPAAESAAQKIAVGERDSEIARGNAKFERVEAKLRNVRVPLHDCIKSTFLTACFC
jgi:hypothetical protein